MTLQGMHHLTAVTADPSANVEFYTRTLGLRLVKKTVNQDDTTAYHLFYGDGVASPGSDITFFDFAVPLERRGTHSIVRTGFRVAGEASLSWWREWLERMGVVHGEIETRGGRRVLDFEDPEGQRLALVDDGGEGEAHPWSGSPIPAEHQIRGLGPAALSVPEAAPTHALLTQVLGMEQVAEEALPAGEVGTLRLYRMGQGGAHAELHLREEPGLSPARPGAGGAHHLAFRIADGDYDAWAAHLRAARVPNSGPVDRFYFRSLYFREPNGILFEIATEGPGFAVDEPPERLGEKLSLPPFLEAQRRSIEARLKPL
ncbi:ring-cleaving dioxygenase [Spiribacter halobius]|uniref:Ring-cleaving dioxygenase n=1 Tax=Sediminicurvatus halobius TaxID=2182432 RepID=A0A2U2N601_9GAMM|nr:ring-cleaving dioxygenase [Spiribacter halobius]PWG64641.1 ring-cleaving dioxygenase [Spiribacter halobius]UEX79035.1 ring-cleaving dioxygenase [Spiribacter halobius]